MGERRGLENMTQAEKLEHYNSRIARYGVEDPRASRWPKHHRYEWAANLHASIVTKLRPQPDLVIDYGCGNGRTTYLFAQQVWSQVLGIDMNPTFVDVANSMHIHAVGDCYIDADINEHLKSLAKEEVDWVISTGCLFSMFNTGQPGHLSHTEIWHQLLRVTRMGFSCIFYHGHGRWTKDLAEQHWTSVQKQYPEGVFWSKFTGRTARKDFGWKGGSVMVPAACTMITLVKDRKMLDPGVDVFLNEDQRVGAIVDRRRPLIS
jgi:SAM-dependent methyltransferase